MEKPRASAKTFLICADSSKHMPMFQQHGFRTGSLSKSLQALKVTRISQVFPFSSLSKVKRKAYLFYLAAEAAALVTIGFPPALFSARADRSRGNTCIAGTPTRAYAVAGSIGGSTARQGYNHQDQLDTNSPFYILDFSYRLLLRYSGSCLSLHNKVYGVLVPCGFGVMQENDLPMPL